MHLLTAAEMADRGYDSDANREAIRARRAEPCFPPRKKRKAAISFDRHLH